MCGILFKTNYYTLTDKLKFEESLELLNHRGPDETGILYTDNFSFGHKRLSIRDITNGKQPMSILNDHLIYNGEIYNINELMRELNNEEEVIHSDSILLLKLLMKYKEKAVEKLNGIFSFVYTYKTSLIAARDHVGVKPLYYSFIDKDIIIASEIKAILKYKGEAIVDKNGIKELLGLCPSNSPGNTIYKGIYELKPGHFILMKKGEFKIEKYFDLIPKEYKLTKEDTKSLVKTILIDSIKNQLVSDVGITSFLSGGLDSSVIVGVTKEEKENLTTYSIDYEDNDADFKENDFEKSKDNDYVYLMNTNHNVVTIKNSTILDYLKTVVHLRDSPGMTDIDASLFYLAKNVKEKFSVALSGECADEIFGGYPWYYKEEVYDSFPWIRNLGYRNSLINKNLNIDLEKYVKEKYQEIIESVPVLKSDSEERIKERRMYYLNVKYFMPALLLRHDRMTMGTSLEVRVPFADKRLVELLYNVPFEYKYYNNTEKALLRDSMDIYIPEKIKNRKKSPYPKSRSRKYSKLIKYNLLKVLEDKNSVLYTLFDSDKLNELINSNEELETPWYGQLMRRDQLLAFLYQIDYWYKEYNIKLEL